MPTKRISINLTIPEDIEAITKLTIELQSIDNKIYSYTDIVRILVKYGLQYPSTVVGKA